MNQLSLLGQPAQLSSGQLGSTAAASCDRRRTLISHGAISDRTACLCQWTASNFAGCWNCDAYEREDGTPLQLVVCEGICQRAFHLEYAAHSLNM